LREALGIADLPAVIQPASTTDEEVISSAP
jgi:hypothetical protein